MKLTFNLMKKDQMIMKNFLLISLVALIGLMTYGTSFGAGSSDNDDSSSKEMVDVDYLNGKEEAYNGNYRAAIVYLKKSIENNPESADSYNLLGYSNRKLGNNEEAFTYYNKALEIDPRHKGTHEYLGKLYLNLKQPENAKKHLAKLDSICFFGCEEYTSLKEAIDGYGKNGTYRKY